MSSSRSETIHNPEFNEAGNSILEQLNTNQNIVANIVHRYSKKFDNVLHRRLKNYSPAKSIKKLHRDATYAALEGLLEQPVFTTLDEGFFSSGDETVADIFEASRQLAINSELPGDGLSIKEKLDLCTMASLIKAHKYMLHRIDPESAKDDWYFNDIAHSINEIALILSLQYEYGFSRNIILNKFIPKVSKSDSEFINGSVHRLEQEERESCPREKSVYLNLILAAQSGDREGWDSVTTWFTIAEKSGIHLPADFVEALFINSRIRDALNKEWATFGDLQSVDPNWDNIIRVPKDSPEGIAYHMLERALEFNKEILERYYIQDSTPISLH